VGEDASFTINTVGMKLKTPGNMVDFTKMGMNRMKWQIPVPWLCRVGFFSAVHSMDMCIITQINYRVDLPC